MKSWRRTDQKAEQRWKPPPRKQKKPRGLPKPLGQGERSSWLQLSAPCPGEAPAPAAVPPPRQKIPTAQLHGPKNGRRKSVAFPSCTKSCERLCFGKRFEEVLTRTDHAPPRRRLGDSSLCCHKGWALIGGQRFDLALEDACCST